MFIQMARPEQRQQPNWAIIKAIGQKIKSVRQNKKISIYKLAERSELSYVTISRIENGHKNLTITTLYEFAKGLKVHPSKLLV